MIFLNRSFTVLLLIWPIPFNEKAVKTNKLKGKIKEETPPLTDWEGPTALALDSH
jgi:hypothetical protein